MMMLICLKQSIWLAHQNRLTQRMITIGFAQSVKALGYLLLNQIVTALLDSYCSIRQLLLNQIVTSYFQATINDADTLIVPRAVFIIEYSFNSNTYLSLSLQEMKADQIRHHHQHTPPQLSVGNEAQASAGRESSLFALYSYLYFIQGLVPGFAATMPYVYDSLPDNNTMILFNLIHLPFSLKFIVAPLLEKYSFVIYGKRKTWMIISLGLTGLTIFAMYFYTEMKYNNIFAILCIIAQSFMAVLDIAEHASMVKQFKSNEKPSVIFNYAQAVGLLVGGLFFLKLTSQEFAQSIGLQTAISTPQTIILIFSIVTLLGMLYVHLGLRETVLKSEIEGDRFSLCQIVSYYQVIFKTSSRYFRVCMFFLIFMQGFNFFDSLYMYNLTEAGFSRNTYNTIINAIVLPKIVVMFYVVRWTKQIGGMPRMLVIAFSILIAIKTYVLIFFPLQEYAVITYVLINQITNVFILISVGLIINSFPINALSGMFITLNSSFSNFGRLQALHIWISGLIGWKLASFVGEGMQVVLTLMMFGLFEWMQRGDVSVPAQIEEQLQNAERKLRQQREQFGQIKGLVNI